MSFFSNECFDHVLMLKICFEFMKKERKLNLLYTFLFLRNITLVGKCFFFPLRQHFDSLFICCFIFFVLSSILFQLYGTITEIFMLGLVLLFNGFSKFPFFISEKY